MADRKNHRRNFRPPAGQKNGSVSGMPANLALPATCAQEILEHRSADVQIGIDVVRTRFQAVYPFRIQLRKLIGRPSGTADVVHANTVSHRQIRGKGRNHRESSKDFLVPPNQLRRDSRPAATQNHSVDQPFAAKHIRQVAVLVEMARQKVIPVIEQLTFRSGSQLAEKFRPHRRDIAVGRKQCDRTGFLMATVLLAQFIPARGVAEFMHRLADAESGFRRLQRGVV